MTAGSVTRVNGPVVEVEGVPEAAMLDLLEIGPERLLGEVIALEGGHATVQVYENTGGLRPGDSVASTGGPLTAELGPGLLGGVFDGMLRMLAGAGDRLAPGGRPSALVKDRGWRFAPSVAGAERLGAGAVLGLVSETEAIEHRVLVPPDIEGVLEWIAPAGDYTVGEPIARIEGSEIAMSSRWPVRVPRPVHERLEPAEPLITGQRVLDLLFPVARGSTAAVPGGFGTGKTLLLTQIAKWCDADVIVYVGCGERGNELADVLEELSTIEDPRTGRSLLDRTVLIANTSNMPVMAREVSIYTGVTVAELYRDMGYHAVVIADSTSRWAEALREVASRAGELPAEEGYPAGLPAALAAFYERAGRARLLGGGLGSVTVLGAVSPPSGDLGEPVTAYTRRFVRSVWSLDRDLAYARHYPAIDWRESSSRDADAIARWYAERGEPSWGESRASALALIAEADRLEAIAELVGVDSLPGEERMLLRSARLLRDGVLTQSATSANDQYSTPAKQQTLLQVALAASDRLAELARRGVPIAELDSFDLTPLERAGRETPPDGAVEVRRIGERVIGLLERLTGAQTAETRRGEPAVSESVEPTRSEGAGPPGSEHPERASAP